MIEIDEKTNKLLNIIKAQNGLKDKSEAIEVMARIYESEILDPPLRPEFIAEMKRKEKTREYVKVKDLKEYLRRLAED
jgi:hypothetical protein